MGLSDVFKDKKTGKAYVYKDVCTYKYLSASESIENGIIFTTTDTDIQTCILCKGCDDNNYYAIPILQFLNYYEPAAGAITEAMNVVEKLKTYEDEGYKKDICTLHSGEPEANEK
jgi:hypothetical protein